MARSRLGCAFSKSPLPILGFGIAVAFWPAMMGAEDSSKWVAAFVLLPLCLFAMCVKPNAIHWALLALFAWADLSLLWTTVPKDGLAALIKLAVIGIAFLVGSGSETTRPFYRWCGLGLWISSGIAIAQWFGYHPVVTGPYPDPSGLFINPNLLAELAAPVLVALLYDRAWWVAIGVLPAVWLPQCRAGILALALTMLCYLGKRWPGRTVLAIPVAAAVVFVLTPMPWLATPFGSERFTIWREVLNGLITSPWRGFGIGSFYATFPKFDTALDWWQVTWHAHNDVLEYAFELGIPAMVFALGIIAAILYMAQERERLVLLAIGITALFGFPLHTGATAVLFGVVAGHAARGWHHIGIGELLGRCALYGRGREFRLWANGGSGAGLSAFASLSHRTGAGRHQGGDLDKAASLADGATDRPA